MSASGIESSGIVTKVTLYPYEITPGSRLKKVVSTQWALYLGDGQVCCYQKVAQSCNRGEVVQLTYRDWAGDSLVAVDNDDDSDDFPPQPQKKIIKRAKALIGKNFHLDSYTDKQVVNECRYGEKINKPMNAESSWPSTLGWLLSGLGAVAVVALVVLLRK